MLAEADMRAWGLRPSLQGVEPWPFRVQARQPPLRALTSSGPDRIRTGSLRLDRALL
jgi:hypothetical protein